MSYDIFFVRRDPGQSFEDALDSTEESYTGGDPGPLTSVELEQWDRVLPHARAVLGDIEEFADESVREFSHAPTGIQLAVRPGEISITVPFTNSDADAVDVMAQVYALARAIEDETGLEGYDPQLGEPIRDASPAAASGPTDPVAGGDDNAYLHGKRLDPQDFQAEQKVARPHRRRWWEFWKS